MWGLKPLSIFGGPRIRRFRFEQDLAYEDVSVSQQLLMEAMRTRLEKSSLPPMVVFDVTNVCNLRCIHCPHAEMVQSNLYKPQHLELKHYQKALDEIGQTGQDCLVRLTGDGEPLLHPHIIEFVQYAKQYPNIVINLTSNGNLLTPSIADTLLQTDIDLIDISLDALSKETYNIVRRGGNFNKLMQNIFYLLNIIAKRKKSTKTMVSFIEQSQNQHEADCFVMFWKSCVDYVLHRNLHSASGLAKQEESRRRNSFYQTTRYPCPHLWKRLTIDFLGNIKFCAHDWSFKETTVLGNISSTTLGEVWAGSDLARLREQHVENAIPEGVACSACSDWASSHWDYGYERLIDNVVYGKPTLLPELPLIPEPSRSNNKSAGQLPA